MKEFVKDFKNGYKIQKVYANEWEGTYGNIYDFYSDAIRAHPDSNILTGYCVIHEATGFVANGCNDWNDTISDADIDYEEHIVPYLKEQESLKFVFDEEIMVSDDYKKVEGYVWATDVLVNRLKAQEPPLKEDQSMENINFYPVYDVENKKLSLKGHYYLEDPYYATGKGFTLELTPEEETRLMESFEAYCLKKEGKSCSMYIRDFVKEHLINQRSLEGQIASVKKIQSNVRHKEMIHKKQR